MSYSKIYEAMSNYKKNYPRVDWGVMYEKYNFSEANSSKMLLLCYHKLPSLNTSHGSWVIAWSDK